MLCLFKMSTSSFLHNKTGAISYFEPVVLDPAGLNVWPVDLGSHPYSAWKTSNKKTYGILDADGNFNIKVTLRLIMRSVKKPRQSCVQADHRVAGHNQ